MPPLPSFTPEILTITLCAKRNKTNQNIKRQFSTHIADIIYLFYLTMGHNVLGNHLTLYES